jgi:hypothetical protein
LPEIVERPDHPWFVGVQFHPELKSKPFDPHPLFASFIEAAVKQSGWSERPRERAFPRPPARESATPAAGPTHYSLRPYRSKRVCMSGATSSAAAASAADFSLSPFLAQARARPRATMPGPAPRPGRCRSRPSPRRAFRGATGRGPGCRDRPGSWATCSRRRRSRRAPIPGRLRPQPLTSRCCSERSGPGFALASAKSFSAMARFGCRQMSAQGQQLGCVRRGVDHPRIERDCSGEVAVIRQQSALAIRASSIFGSSLSAASKSERRPARSAFGASKSAIEVDDGLRLQGERRS